ncbi:9978_t:CDS:2 [Scutellospora calospora]|uniref:9978_t:CDS:1 n=1 Tax=Scutellospora calospora TaxID=85575 RepID=A0ACA9KWP0_9GLOM|nr:9978_t:CDS:2 [Scutellospora calospora]
MYSSEIEPQNVRSVIESTNGRSSQRRTGSGNASASSRLFMNAVKDASRGSRGAGEKHEENGTDRITKRAYSPGMDQSKDDLKTKARKVESESRIDKHRVYESDYSHDKTSRIKTERQSGDQGLFNVLQEHEHSRYISERRSSQQIQQPRSVLDRLGKKGGLMTAYINPAFIQNSNASSIPAQSNSNITLTSKVSRCRHWPNCDLGAQCKFHHPTEICPMVPNCPNSPRTCLYIHPASQDFNTYEQRGLYRQNSFVNGTNGQAAFGSRSIDSSSFGFGPIGQDPMNNFIVGQSAGGFNGMGQGVFGNNSNGQNNGSFVTGLYGQNSLKQSTSHNVASVQALNIQGQRDAGQKLKSDAGSVNSTTSITATVNTSTSTTTNNIPTGIPSSQDMDITSSQAIAVLCKYGEHCANPNCMYAHSSPAAVGTGTIPTSLLDVPCKFGAKCVNPKCHYSHPSPANLIAQEPCKFYPNCQNPMCPYLHVGNRPNCAYSHPTGKSETTQNISERTFVSVPDEMTEKIIPTKDNNNDESLQIDKIKENGERLEDGNNHKENGVDNEVTQNKETEVVHSEPNTKLSPDRSTTLKVAIKNVACHLQT